MSTASTSAGNARIPFAYALVDRRHRPYAAGRRPSPRRFVDNYGGGQLFLAACYLTVSLFLFGLGARGLIAGALISGVWRTATGTVTDVVPRQSGDRFVFDAYYTFTTVDNAEAHGSAPQDTVAASSAANASTLISAVASLRSAASPRVTEHPISA